MPASNELRAVVERIFSDDDLYFVQLDIGEMDDDGNDCHKATSFPGAMEHIESVDDTIIHVYRKDKEESYVGWISVTLWNDGEEQIIDYTLGKEIEAIIGD